MENLLLLAGRVAGVVGVLVCAIAVLMRLAGMYTFGGLGTITLLQAGIAAMVAGCLAFLAVLVNRGGGR